jgi:uncharacterized Tic20 family protein
MLPDLAPSREAKNMSALIHLSGIFGAVPTLVLWALTRKERGVVEEQGIEALNFQIQVALLEIPLAVSGLFLLPQTFVQGTLFFLGPLYLYRFVLCLWAAFQSKQEGRYSYPVLFTRWLKVSPKSF